MKLTKIQLEKIRIYLDEVGFKYVDVQMEILDHVASAVEEKMTADPNLTFQDAVNQTRTSFGKNGFYAIEKSIVKGLSKKYWKLFLYHFTSLLGFRYFWMFSLAIFGLYQLQNLIADQDVLLNIFALVFIVFFSMLIYFSRDSELYGRYKVCKVSGSYIGYVCLFFIIGSDAIEGPSKDMIFGLNESYLYFAILMNFFAIYTIAALKTEKAGILESKAIADKLRFLYY